jgi:hypothetical protein
MARKRDTDEGEPYSSPDEAAVADVIDDAIEQANLAILRAIELEEEAEEAVRGEEEAEEAAEPQMTGTIDVRAQIEWAGTIDHPERDGGVRRTVLDGVSLNGIGSNGERFGPGILQAAEDLRQARQTGPDQPYRSYNAKGWRAQLRQALGTRRGREAVERAGLNPDTIRRWQRGTQAPSKTSRARIAELYGDLRDPRTAAVRDARHGVAEALTDALRERYGVSIRLRNIEHLHIQRED